MKRRLIFYLENIVVGYAVCFRQVTFFTHKQTPILLSKRLLIILIVYYKSKYICNCTSAGLNRRVWNGTSPLLFDKKLPVEHTVIISEKHFLEQRGLNFEVMAKMSV